jgi:hypothetical protein
MNIMSEDTSLYEAIKVMLKKYNIRETLEKYNITEAHGLINGITGVLAFTFGLTYGMYLAGGFLNGLLFYCVYYFPLVFM